MQDEKILKFLGGLVPKYLNQELDGEELHIGDFEGFGSIYYRYDKIPVEHGLKAVGNFEELNENKKAMPTTMKEVRQRLALPLKVETFELILMKKTEKGYEPLMAEADDEPTGLLKKMTLDDFEKLEQAQYDFFYKRRIISKYLSQLIKELKGEMSLSELLQQVYQIGSLFGLVSSNNTDLEEIVKEFEQT